MDTLVNIGIMIGLGLGIIGVIAIMYYRLQRMNERNDELRICLTKGIEAIQQQEIAMVDLKSASVRASEMDRLYQENHRAVMSGQTAIVTRLPDAVDDLSSRQERMALDLEDLRGYNNSILNDISEIKNTHFQSQGSVDEQLQKVMSQIASGVSQTQQISQGLAAVLSIMESNQEVNENLLVEIQKKLLEDY